MNGIKITQEAVKTQRRSTVKPVNGYVLTKKAVTEQKTQSGIVIAGVRQKGYDDLIQAEVVDIAVDMVDDPSDSETPIFVEVCKKGDRILFKKGLSEKVEIEYDPISEYYLVKKDDIMAVI